jgi:hypothetical protein
MRLALLIAALLSVTLSAGERLTVTTPGTISLTGRDWWVRVRVEPHTENRWLTIEADGDQFFRRSDFQLEGEDAPIIHHLWFKQLPAGCYDFTATLRATGEAGRILARAQGRRLSVRGIMMEGDPCGGSDAGAS